LLEIFSFLTPGEIRLLLDFARKGSVPFWDNCSVSEQRACIKLGQKTRAGGAGWNGREFSIQVRQMALSRERRSPETELRRSWRTWEAPRAKGLVFIL
jgi:hypothetical protein